MCSCTGQQVVARVVKQLTTNHVQIPKHGLYPQYASVGCPKCIVGLICVDTRDEQLDRV